MGLWGRRTKIRIDYSLCGEAEDPRGCCLCMRVCEPAVFQLHQSFGVEQADIYDPDNWRITALWPSLCTRCRKCEEVCPKGAIHVSW
jgi:formate hydrogenlyase subunit 6/NADH:ubiquinone oxidoreductase subunit I